MRAAGVAGGVASRPPRSTAATAVVAVLAATASLSLTPWLGKPMFPDEGVSLRSARLSWTALLSQSRTVDLVLLPYYALLHEWIRVSEGLEWARLLSLVAYGLTVFLVGYLAARWGGSWCGVLAAALAATSPLLVAAALSARPYALSALLATVAVAVLVRWAKDGRAAMAWWFACATLATLALQMFAVLAPLSALAAAAALRPRGLRGRWRAAVGPIGLTLAATLSFAVAAAAQRRQIAWIPSLVTGRQLVDAVEGPASGQTALFGVVVLVIAGAAAAVCLKAWSRGAPEPTRAEVELLAICFAWAAFPTAALVAVSLARHVYVARYATASVPGLAIGVSLLSARAVDAVVGRRADRARVAGIVALACAVVLVWLVCSLPAARATYELAR